MSMKNIHDKLMAQIKNEFGVYALMGNLKAESGLKANNLQNTGNTKLNMTDEEYTEMVDNGLYTHFVNDGKGYGLAQWTYYSRKQNLLDYAKKVGKSIGDEDMQIEFLLNEIKGYQGVWYALVNAKSIKAASDVVLTKYERPADQSDKVKELRASYGKVIMNELVGGQEMKTRAAVVALVNSWVGKNESDGSFKSIIDVYNSYTGKFPRGTKMQYDWAWCACTWSALAIKLGYTDIMPIEISCYYLIEAAKKMGIWQENDGYTPKIGDAVLYDWQDTGAGDNAGNPDHVGTVTEVYGSTFVVVEGNYSNAVKKRTMSINGRYIRGFICPKYDADGEVANPQVGGKSLETVAREVIAGTWGNGDARKSALEKAGYNYSDIQKAVNTILNGGSISNVQQQVTQTAIKEVTAVDYATSKSTSVAGTYKTIADLYMRTGAGTNKKALVCMPKGTEVNCYGYYSTVSGVKWLYIQTTIDGVKYTGFSSSKYLSK